MATYNGFGFSGSDLGEDQGGLDHIAHDGQKTTHAGLNQGKPASVEDESASSTLPGVDAMETDLTRE